MNFFKFKIGYKPSEKMLDEVGFNFDHDLGGLKKETRFKKSHLNPLWLSVLVLLTLFLLWVDLPYGFLFIIGFVYGAIAILIWFLRG